MIKSKTLLILPLMTLLFLIPKMKGQVDVTYTNISKKEMMKVLEQVNNWFANTPIYSCVVTHTSYEDYLTTIPFEKSVGYFKKDKDNYHSFLLGIHSIENSNYKITIDSSQKIIIVANVPNHTQWNTYSIEDYINILNLCTAIKVQDRFSDKLYRIEFAPGSEIHAFEFLFTQEGIMKEIVEYYGKEININDDERSPKTKPRLCIAFSNYNKNCSFNYRNEFDEKKYLIKNENKFILTEKYKQYTISDQRFILN